MGWKSTIHICRGEAIELIKNRLLDATDDQLANAVESLGYGDMEGLDYFGHNFLIQNREDAERELYEKLKRKYGDE